MNKEMLWKHRIRLYKKILLESVIGFCVIQQIPHAMAMEPNKEDLEGKKHPSFVFSGVASQKAEIGRSESKSEPESQAHSHSTPNLFSNLNDQVLHTTKARPDSLSMLKDELAKTNFKNHPLFKFFLFPQELISKTDKDSLKEPEKILAPLTSFIKSLQESLEKVDPNVKASLIKALTIYYEFRESFKEASVEGRQEMVAPPVKLNFVGDFPPYLIEHSQAYSLTSADAYGYQIRLYSSIHPVSAVGGMHFKKHSVEPIQPGMERVVYHFFKHLHKTIINPSLLFRLEGIRTLTLPKNSNLLEFINSKCYEKNITYEDLLKRNPDLKENIDKAAVSLIEDTFIQASLTIKGTTLHSLLEGVKEEGNFEHLVDHESFSALCLGSFLFNFTDAKPNNLMREEASKVVIGIDNDLCLAEDIYLINGKHYSAVKNVLYLIKPLMELPIHSEVVKRILKTPPLQFIWNWLEELERENSTYRNALSFEDQKQLGLPISFIPGTLIELYRKLELLHSILKEGVTHSQVFRTLQPLLSLYYQTLNTEDPLESYHSIHSGLSFEEVFNVEKFIFKDKTLYQWLSPYRQNRFAFQDGRTQSLDEARIELLRKEGVGNEFLQHAIQQNNKPLIHSLFVLGVGAPKNIIKAIRTADFSLSSLDLSEKSLIPQQVKDLGQALENHSSLTSVGLRRTQLQKEGLDDLVRGLRGHKNLTNLDLSRNEKLEIMQDSPLKDLAPYLLKLNLSYTPLKDDAVIGLVKGLPHLNHFEVAGTYISFKGGKAILESLKSLLHLDISHIKQPQPISCFIEMLSHHKSLKELNLSHNKITDKGVSMLEGVFKASASTLAMLNLHYNLIEQEGFKSIGKGLESNNSIKTLILSNNNGGDVGAKAMAQMLAINETLKHLNVSRNFIGVTGANALGNAALKNTDLTFMDITHNEIPVSKKSEIQTLFSKNPSVTLRF